MTDASKPSEQTDELEALRKAAAAKFSEDEMRLLREWVIADGRAAQYGCCDPLGLRLRADVLFCELADKLRARRRDVG